MKKCKSKHKLVTVYYHYQVLCAVHNSMLYFYMTSSTTNTCALCHTTYLTTSTSLGNRYFSVLSSSYGITTCLVHYWQKHHYAAHDCNHFDTSHFRSPTNNPSLWKVYSWKMYACATYLIFCKWRVPQSYILPCSVFQIKVIRFKLFKILENSERSLQKHSGINSTSILLIHPFS